MNMKILLKIIDEKAEFSECEKGCELNVLRMGTWAFTKKEANINLNVITIVKLFSKMMTNVKLWLKMIENKPKACDCEIECLIQCQTKVKLNV